jgi:hypothetical protein
LLRDIYVKLIAPIEHLMEPSDWEGLYRLCRDRKYAHLASDYMLLMPMALPPCSISLVPRAYYPGMFTIATAKRNPYRGILNFK